MFYLTMHSTHFYALVRRGRGFVLFLFCFVFVFKILKKKKSTSKNNSSVMFIRSFGHNVSCVVFCFVINFFY